MKTLIALVILLTPSLAMAQDDWSDPLSSDYFGFSDGASTVRQASAQFELGVTAAKPTGQPFSAALGLTGRYGLFDGLELRIDIPSFTFIFDDSGRGVGVLTVFETVELGAKWQLPLSDAFTLSLLPYFIAPTTLSGSDIVGGGLGILLDVPLGDTFSITANVLPRFQNITIGAVSTNVFDVSGSASLNLGLSNQLSGFAEGWGTLVVGGDVVAGGNVGLTYLAMPELQFGLVFGVDNQPSFSGTLGAVYRWN